MKRLLDLFGSTVGLVLLAVPFAVIAVLIKLDSPGPVFFRIERVGQNGKPFVPWKFRTMVAGAPNMGLGLNVSESDSRITRLGNFLRNSSIDELPQLINVLRGEMSLVGPRPTFAHQVAHYDDSQRRRLLAKPGVTGLAAIKGRNSISWEQRFEWDLWYVDHWSFGLDLKILVITQWKAFVTREGLYGEAGVNDDFGADK